MMGNLKCKVLRKLIIILPIFCISIGIIFSEVYAHPGRTDANGGHWDRKSGTYHFHTGEYAGRSSSGSSYQSEYVPFTPPYDPPTNNPYHTEKPCSNTDVNNTNVSQDSSNKEPDEDIPIFFIAIATWLTFTSCLSLLEDGIHTRYGGACLLFFMFGIAFHIVLIATSPIKTIIVSVSTILLLSIPLLHAKISDNLSHKRGMILDDIMRIQKRLASLYDDINLCNESIDKEKKKIENIHKNIPKAISITDDYELLSEFPNAYNVYVAKTGRTVHKTSGCSGAYNIVNIVKTHYKKPCKKCFANPCIEVAHNCTRNIIEDAESGWYRQYCYDLPIIKHHICDYESRLCTLRKLYQENYNFLMIAKQGYLKNKDNVIKDKKLTDKVNKVEKILLEAKQRAETIQIQLR